MKLIAVRVDESAHKVLEKAAALERRSLAAFCRNVLLDRIQKGPNAKDGRETAKR